MTRGRVVWFVVGCVLAPLVAAHYHHVVELTAANFDVEVPAAGFVFVEFYQQHHNPELDDTARLLKDFSVAAVHCKTNAQLCHRFHVTTFPTYKLFRDGIDTTFEGEATAKDFIYFCLDHLDRYLDKKAAAHDIFDVHIDDSALIHLRSMSEVKAFQEVEDVAIVGLFKSEDDPRLRVYVQAAAMNNEGLVFGVVHAHSLIDILGGDDGEVQVYVDGELHTSTHSGGDEEMLSKWISTHAFRPLRLLDDKNVERRLFDGLPTLTVIVPGSMADAGELVSDGVPELPLGQVTTEELQRLAGEFRGLLSFLYAFADDIGDIGESLAVDTHALPAFVIFDPATEDKFVLRDAHEKGIPSIREHCRAFLANELSPTLRSAPLRPHNLRNHSTGVWEVVGLNVNDALRTKGDVLLLVYAEWCPHSGKFLPIFDAIAARFSSASHLLTFAKINVEENDLPREVQVGVVPSLLLFKDRAEGDPRGTPITFSGERHEDKVVKFIADNAAHGAEIAKADQKAAQMKEALKMAQ